MAIKKFSYSLNYFFFQPVSILMEPTVLLIKQPQNFAILKFNGRHVVETEVH